MFIRNSLRIVKILETSKKHGGTDICSIDNKILIFKNNYSVGHSKLHIAQRRIQITVKYLRWTALRK